MQTFLTLFGVFVLFVIVVILHVRFYGVTEQPKFFAIEDHPGYWVLYGNGKICRVDHGYEGPSGITPAGIKALVEAGTMVELQHRPLPFGVHDLKQWDVYGRDGSVIGEVTARDRIDAIIQAAAKYGATMPVGLHTITVTEKVD